MSEYVIDSSLPWLEDALDVECATASLYDCGVITSEERVCVAKMVRHREGRRSLIEYDVCGESGERARTLLGKSREKGVDRRTVRNLRSLRVQGFAEGTADGISVPEVIGVVEPWRMWLMPKIPWLTYCGFIDRNRRIQNARKAALCARKLHGTRIDGLPEHSIENEIALLDGFLDQAARARPALAGSILELKETARSVGAAVRNTERCVIHRDFYPDQLLFNEDRSVMLDVDLLSFGDPHLDIGNFSAHLIETAIREYGDPHALDDERHALISEYARSADYRRAILAWEAISLARHVWISIRIGSRNNSTELVLAEAQRRLENIEQGASLTV